MCYDSPKAAHFRAFGSNGPRGLTAELGWNDPVGLRLRWEAAELAKQYGCHDMLPGRRNMEAIRLAIADVNRREDYFRVELDERRIG